MDRKYKKISLHYLHYLHYGGGSAESAMQKNDMRKVRILRIPTIISANFYEGQKKDQAGKRRNEKIASKNGSMYQKGLNFRPNWYMLKCERYYFTSCPVRV